MVTLEQHISRQKLSSYLGGDSSTPLDLVQEMVESIPQEIKKNPNSKFLDPAAGTGSFIIVLFYELNKYHSEEHILNNMLYVCEVNRFKLRMLKNLGIKNIYGESFLKQDFKDMKFDVIIGNPPYQNGKKEGGQNKIYNLFCKQGLSFLKENGILYFVVPSSVCKKSKRFSLLNQPGLKLVDFTSDNYFKVGVNICSFLIDKSYSGLVTVKNNDGQATQPNTQIIRNLEGIDLNFIGIYDSLKELMNHPKKRMFGQNNVGPEASKKQTEQHIYPIYKINKKGEKVLVQYNKPIPKFHGLNKYIISMSKGFNVKNVIIDTDDYDVAHLCIAINNKTQIDNINSFIFSDYFKTHSENWKNVDGYGFNYALKYLPPFDINKSWTNNEVKEFIENFNK